MQPVEDTELQLRDYLGVLRRRFWVIALVVVLVTAAALASSLLQTPVYAASADLLLQRRSVESPFDPETGAARDPNRQVQTEIRVIESKPVRDRVRDEIGTAPDVGASPRGQTDVVEIRAESVDPQVAARVANAYANAYIEYRREQSVRDFEGAMEVLQRRIADFQTRISAIDQAVSAAPPPQRQGVADGSAAERAVLTGQLEQFRQKVNELQVSAELTSGGAQLVTPASVPSSPVRPTPVRNGVVAGVVGLILGVGLAFLLEHLDDTVRSKEELERLLPGVSTLALVPAIPEWKDRKRAMVIAAEQKRSVGAEAYRTLRTSVQFLGLDRPLRVLQVTSAGPGEGKTTTLANLAVTMADAGQRVVVVCTDLRRPRVHEFFGLDNAVGVTSVLAGDVPLEQALQRVPVAGSLSLLASGPVPPNPAELLASRRMAEVVTGLQGQFDTVLIDSPPVLPVTDAAVLSRWVDGTILVVTAGRTKDAEAVRAVELLSQVDAPVIGTVLNNAKDEAGYGGYGYRGGYGYSAREAKADAKTAKRGDGKNGRSEKAARAGADTR